MNRRDFLKSTCGLAVASAFPMPAPAELTFKGVPLVLDEEFLNAYAANVTNEYWKGDGVVMASDTFMAEMRSQWVDLIGKEK